METLRLLSQLGLLDFAVTATILILLIFLSKQSLKKINNIVNILTNGAYHDCPYYITQIKNGRRFYDQNKLGEGGDSDER